MELTFRIAKLLDYAKDIEAIENNTNPYARIALAHLRALTTKDNPRSRQAWKLRLVKGLYEGKWSKDDVRKLFRLIDWIMVLPEALDDAFHTEIFASAS